MYPCQDAALVMANHGTDIIFMSDEHGNKDSAENDILNVQCNSDGTMDITLTDLDGARRLVGVSDAIIVCADN